MRSKFTSREVWICVVLALVSRIAIAALFIQYKPSIIREPWTGTFARWAGDTPSYFEAVDSWLSGGVYAPDWRPPGYAFVYLLARLVAAPPQAADLIVVLQVLVSTIAAL